MFSMLIEPVTFFSFSTGTIYAFMPMWLVVLILFGAAYIAWPLIAKIGHAIFRP